MAKVKVCGEWRSISLRLRVVPGTKREAQQRADSLQTEIKSGILSDATRVWLGDVTAAKLAVEIGRGQAKIAEGSPDTWNAAGQAWLRACESRDTRQIPEGRAKAEEKTKKSRKYKLKSFLDWATENQVPFLKEPFTETAIRYIEHRKSQGIGASTMWNADFSTVCTWGEWLASKRICEPVDRDRIRELMPARPVVEINLPTWRDDLDNLRFYFKIRRYGDWAKPLEGRNRWKMLRSHQSAWSVVLIVRGLGCRPSEATALSWETVDLANNKVLRPLQEWQVAHGSDPLAVGQGWARRTLGAAGQAPMRCGLRQLRGKSVEGRYERLGSLPADRPHP